MSFESWLTFTVAAAIILVVPGPTLILVISQAMTYGRRSALPLVCGVICGDFTAMVLSLAGLSAILSTSATLFNVFKWVGVLYLLYLGVKTWKTNPAPQLQLRSLNTKSKGAFFRNAYIVTALNPKGIAFFAAFLPQFIDPHHPVPMQLGILGGTFLLLALINSSVYASFASGLCDILSNATVRKWINRFGGSALIAAGLLTAKMQRSS